MISLGRNTHQNLTRIAMTIGAPPRDEFTVRYGPIDGLSRPGRVEFCVVFARSGIESERLCYREDDGDRSAVVVIGGIERTLAIPSDVTVSDVATGGVALAVAPSAGLRYDPDSTFYWESRYDGALADRLPDSGDIALIEIVGR